MKAKFSRLQPAGFELMINYFQLFISFNVCCTTRIAYENDRGRNNIAHLCVNLTWKFFHREILFAFSELAFRNSDY